MAVRAGKVAVERAGVPLHEYGLHIHASLWFQGLDWWSPANYIANNTVGTAAVTFGMDQRSLGGLTALHLGAAYLTAGAAEAALITTGDRFAAPAIDRWNTQAQLIFGDGGTAAVLSKRGGPARLVATVSFGENSLEGWSRGLEPFGSAPGQEAPVPVLRRVMQRMERPEAGQELQQWNENMLLLKDRVLEEAGLDIKDITRAAMPFQHRGGGQAELHDLIGLTEEQTVWRELGRYTGHIGAGDPFAGLNYLLENKEVQPGDHVLIYGCGYSFNFSAAVVEITEPPVW
jgi:3-oxoacyl-[acyl-carrier-protein] synthase-3